MITQPKTHRTAAIAAALILNASVALAQAPQPLPPEATDPVKLELMKGFPPPPDKIVKLSSVLKFPNGRWAFHHMRELGPTAQVWRGDEKPSVLRDMSREMDTLKFEDDKGVGISLADWQRTTYTDGLLVLHKGVVVHQKYHAGMRAQQPHLPLILCGFSFGGFVAAATAAPCARAGGANATRATPRYSAWMALAKGVVNTVGVRASSGLLFRERCAMRGLLGCGGVGKGK